MTEDGKSPAYSCPFNTLLLDQCNHIIMLECPKKPLQTNHKDTATGLKTGPAQNTKKQSICIFVIGVFDI